jgi:predicted DNA-binding protein YlxM (UPF0122 family)
MPIVYEMVTGQQIIELAINMKRKHLPQREVADAVNVSRQNFYNYIYNRRMPVEIYENASEFVNEFTV